MKNDCVNLYKGRLCWNTVHEVGRNLVAHVCSYTENCYDCKDYKRQNKIQ